MHRLVSFLRSLFSRMRRSLARFPAAVLFAATLGIVLLYDNHNNLPDSWVRLEMTLGLGIALGAFAAMLAERLSARGQNGRSGLLIKISVNLGIILLLILYGLFLTARQGAPGSDLRAFRLMGFISTAVLLFLSIRHWYRRPGLEIHTIHVFVRALVTLVFTGVLCGGLDAILFASDKLFDLHIQSRIYTDVVILVFTFFTPLYFFSGIPGGDTAIPRQNDSVPAFIRILVLYIVLPLLTVYMAIVALYCLKVLTSAPPWPENLVARLIFYAAPFSVASLFLAAPLENTSRWARFALRLVPSMFLPLSVMMFIALWVRIKAFGMTEQRYFVLVMGAWAVLSMLHYALYAFKSWKKTARRTFNPMILPLSLAIVVFLMVLGPQSAYSVSRYSQNFRFVRIVSPYGLITDERLDADKALISPAISRQDSEELMAVLTYFSRKYSLNAMPALSELDDPSDVYILLHMEANKPADRPDAEGAWFSYGLTQKTTVPEMIPVDGYDHMLMISGNLFDPGQPPATGYAVAISAGNTLDIFHNGVSVLKYNLTPLIANLNNAADFPSEEFAAGRLTVKVQSPSIDIMLVIRNVTGRYWPPDKLSETGVLSLDMMEGILLLRENE